MQTQHTQTQAINFPQSGYIVSTEGTQSYPINSADNTRLSSQEVAVASVGLLLLFTVWFFVRQSLRQRKTSEAELLSADRSLSKAKRLTHYLPCTNCHYFKANMYLPCAVNPMVVLKPEAKDCSDFKARNGHEYTEVTG